MAGKVLDATAVETAASAHTAHETRETRETHETHETHGGQHGHRPASRFWVAVLDRSDSLVYILVGICFFVAALFSLAYGIGRLGFNLSTLIGGGVEAALRTTDAARYIIEFVSDLLLTLIIMEVLGTVVHYLRKRETTLKPFLFIGVVSATRGILAVGARLSVTESGTFTPDDFRGAMIELGVNAAVIIALGVTMKLIGPLLDDRAMSRQARGEGEAARE